MKQLRLEAVVGLFVAAGLLCLAYLSIELARVQFFGGNMYTLTAVFPTVSGLRNGATVEIAGVTVGHVQSVKLDGFDAVVTMRVRKDVELSNDAIVSIRTRGLIGEKYLRVSQGADERSIPAGGRVREVEPPLDFEEMISQLIQGKI
ncbi:MAG: outer membrane lipid asymmetry maintenance protein MlaD [Candidatus Tectomicrobia bacterium]|nr:outer membrane lipid asymmetry maintenance protein MlaD [Candidatus Tectomicrobia bacterium]